MVISTKTRLYGILGDPIEHSLSPTIQNAAFRGAGIDAIYLAFRVDKGRLQDALTGVRSLGILGVNVTIPYKVDVIQYIDHLDTEAEAMGAVNTIKNDAGKLTGYNTDGLGAVEALRGACGGLAHARVALMGSGGAARAIAFSLARERAKITVLNRSLEKAQTMALQISEKLGIKIECLALNSENLERTIPEVDVLINATSIGMAPKSRETPVKKEMIHPRLVVFDIVYSPLETRLLKEARAAGANAVDGLEMLVHQGAAAFEIWTGRKAPIEVMRNAALERLKEGYA